MVGIAVVRPSASDRLGQALLFDDVSKQSICSLLNVLTESVAQGSICAAVSSLGIFFLDLLETGELTIPDPYTKNEALSTPPQYGVQQDESTWLREAVKVYSRSLLDLMDKKEVPSSVQVLAFELLKDLVASEIPFHLNSEIHKRVSKKMAFAPTQPIPVVEGSALTNYKYEDKRANQVLGFPRHFPKYACKLSRSEKKITELPSNGSAIVNVNERERSKKRKACQWALVAATRDDDDDDDEDAEGEDDDQGECDNDDEDNDEEEEGDGEASDEDVGDEGEEDEPEEEEEDDEDDDDEDSNEDDDEEDEEEEEEPPKKKKK